MGVGVFANERCRLGLRVVLEVRDRHGEAMLEVGDEGAQRGVLCPETLVLLAYPLVVYPNV